MPGFVMQDIFIHITRVPGRMPGAIRSEAWLVEREKEEKAVLYFDDNMIIRGATHYSFRGDAPEKTEINGVAGISYLEGPGRILRRNTSPEVGDLFFEALNAMAQGQGMIFAQERQATRTGDEKPADCFYFNSPEADLPFVMLSYSGHFNTTTYFTRIIHVGVFPVGKDGSSRLKASFLDPVHEIIIELELDPERTCRASSALVYHRPAPGCYGAGTTMKSLVGVNLDNLDFRNIKKKIGGPDGCLHLSDLTTRAIQFVKQTQVVT